jgi:methionyl-tRNA synthetase
MPVGTHCHLNFPDVAPEQVALAKHPKCVGFGEALLDLLEFGPDERDFAHAGEAYALAEGAPPPAPVPIFPRYVEEEEKDVS